MPVVINEFEVLDTAQRDAAPTGDHVAATAPPRPDPEDLRRWLAEQAEQQLRLQAS